MRSVHNDSRLGNEENEVRVAQDPTGLIIKRQNEIEVACVSSCGFFEDVDSLVNQSFGLGNNALYTG